MSSASTIPPHFPLGTQPGQMHPPSQPVMDPARNDYAPRSYPWPSAIEPIAYSQAQAMLAATYANHAVASQAHGQALPLAVQNDAAALEMAHQQYQSQLTAHANAYGLAPATIMDDQLAAFYEQQPPVATIALHPYADANPYQFQPPNARAPSSITENILAPHTTTSSLAQVQPTRATLHFSNLEAWMDVEYFSKVAGMMNWQNVILKIPHVPSNERVSSSGKNGSLVPNNPGYCFMTFSTPASATAVLNALTEGDKPKLMPNSKRPFVVTWATVPASSARTNGQRVESLGHDAHAASLFAPGGLTLLNPHAVPAIDEPVLQSSTRQQEFSIFVGDLAPETTNSDLIAVFRDPILGLRHDREPKFVAPFLSCKSAKIMVDPVMGVSKGYGFVRFGTMADASRALIEMQGLYCLSRPMRISQATAKARTHGFLPPGSAPGQTHGTPPQPFTPPFDYDVHSNGSDRGTGSTVTSPSVVHPVNAHAFMVGHRENTSPTGSNSSGRSLQEAQRIAPHRGAVGSESDPLDSLPSDTLDALSSLNIDRNTLSQLLKMAMVRPVPDQEGGDHSRSASDPLSAPAAIRYFGQSDGTTYRASMAGSGQGHAPSQSYSQSMSGTSARSAAPPRNVGPQSSPVDAAQASQAKALLASMIGNNASALNSSDPYNTTVFVGGLSGLISEDTLRTFFGPFGDIHYVKIPPGKGCGFVQFVRKADAEAAISKMQGFPIGGGRVRLSWGRSQYKAAQAAAQAVNFGASVNETGNLQGVSETQATQILQALGVNNTGSNAFPDQRLPGDFQNSRGFGHEMPYGAESTGTFDQYDIRAAPGPHSAMQGENDLGNVNLSRSHTFPMFTPFGGEPNTFSPPNNVSASRSVAGMTVKPHTYGTGPTALYGGSMALRGSISQRDLEGMENGYAIDSYSDRVHGSYPIRGSGTFQPNDLIRQERAGSGSTIATTASDKTPPPQPMKHDVFDLTGNFAALNFGQNSSFDVYPPHMPEANGMLSPTFGAYMSNKSPKRQYS